MVKVQFEQPKCPYCGEVATSYCYKEKPIRKVIGLDARDEISAIEITCWKCGSVISVVPSPDAVADAIIRKLRSSKI